MLQQAWLRRGLLACLLWPLAQLYRALVAARRWAYTRGWAASRAAPVPVLVVGNVIAGGAGKTPVVMAVVRHLQARGLAVGVVSRGYGRRTPEGREVQPGDDPRDVGDEPLLIRRATGAPVVVDRDRVAATERLLAAHPQLQLIVSDDGLQHLALRRDVEIVVFDERGTGNGWLLPAGPLREPWPRAARTPPLVLHTGTTAAFDGFRGQRALADHALTQDGRQVPLDSLASQPQITALAGIARPQAFFSMLEARGIHPARTLALPDHAGFDAHPLPGGAPGPLLCTEKDAAKLWRVAPEALAVPLRFTPEPDFFAALDARLAARLAR